VDSGQHKIARYDADRAIDSLELERVPRDAADQRAGRAGRTAPGVVIRLWDERDRLRPHREAEIHRVDLSSALLDVVAWGGDPWSFEWFDPPSPASLQQAARLLERLGALEGTRVTAIGDQLQRLPLHPRLGRILIEAGAAFEAAVVCAVLSERSFAPARHMATTSDLLSAVDDFDRLPSHVRQVARQIHEFATRVMTARARAHVGDVDLRRAIFLGYPDRLARRRSRGSPRLVLASGHGAVLLAESGVTEGEFLVAAEVQAGRTGPGSEARVRIASRVEPAWIEPHLTVSAEHRFDAASGTVRAVELCKYDSLVVSERAAEADPHEAARMLAAEYLRGDLPRKDAQLLRRLRFAGRPIAVEDLAATAARGARRLADVSLIDAVPADLGRLLEREAPERLSLPSGRTAALEYQEDGSVQAAVKLQELFGLADTPRVGTRREPVLLLLLAPNGRPVQTTRDLRSFWDRTYPEVRRELRGRYPKHPWPEDPWTAPPTAKTTSRHSRR
jgi:ATP-dependent helicase HrpB